MALDFLCSPTNDLASLDQGSLNCLRPQKFQNWCNSTFCRSWNMHENSLDIKCGVEYFGILPLYIYIYINILHFLLHCSSKKNLVTNERDKKIKARKSKWKLILNWILFPTSNTGHCWGDSLTNIDRCVISCFDPKVTGDLVTKSCKLTKGLGDRSTRDTQYAKWWEVIW